MLRCGDFSRICKKHSFNFFSGVPDSTFKSWMSFLENENTGLKNIIAVNECEAVAICTGYHLATGKIGVLYMQNDGFGKTVNPLTSLCDPEVYNIPILLMIGWRGEPGKKDAYQHHRMGKIILPLLDLLEIPYEIMSSDIEKVDNILRKAKDYMKKSSRSFAIIVKKGIFDSYSSGSINNSKKIKREEALGIIMKHLNDEIIVSTTGKLSRELFEYRAETNRKFDHDFYNIGAMGCAQSIAIGIALQKKDKKIFVFDGDGSVLMQMGGIATIGHYLPNNLYHIVFDNRAHDSTGGQPTCSDTVDFVKVAKACNYRFGRTIKNRKELATAMGDLKKIDGPAMLVVEVKKGAKDVLRRPNKTPVEYKMNFMRSLMGSE